MYGKVRLSRRISLRIQQLDMFLALMETSSVRATADIMGLTQSAVSKSQKELESTMRTALFERTCSGLRPTAQSVLLERYAHEVIRGFNLPSRELHAQAGEESLSVGASTGGAHVLLMHVIGQLLGEWPLRVAVQIEDSRLLAENLIDGALGISVAYATPAVLCAEVCRVPAGYDSIVAVAHPNHPVFRDSRSYLHYPWMVPASDEPLREAVEQRMAEAGQRLPRALVECSLGLSKPEVATRDDVVVWTTRTLADPGVARGELRCVNLPFPPPMLNYYAMRMRKRYLPPGGVAMWNALLRALRRRRHRARRDLTMPA